MQPCKTIICTTVLTIFGIGLLGANSVEAQSFSIDWFTIDGGGGVSSAGGFELVGTIGQPDTGPTMTGGGFAISGGFWAGGNQNSIILGDVNGDGVVNLLDVAPFVDAISTGTFVPEADINQDGVVNLLDVNPFIDLLSG